MAHTYTNRSEPGRHTTTKGYVRLKTANGRDQLEHRFVMNKACQVFCYYPPTPTSAIPNGMVVHHIDFDKRHNCIGNLLLTDAVLHAWFDFGGRNRPDAAQANSTVSFTCPTCGRVRQVPAVDNTPPDWVTNDTSHSTEEVDRYD